MNKESLLGEIEDVLRTMPPKTRFGGDHDDETLPWLGRAAAAIERWNITHTPACSTAVRELQSEYTTKINAGFASLQILLNQARADLRFELGQGSIVLDHRQVFEYFDELRKVIEPARTEVFFVDAYLDAEFVSRYLPLVPSGAAIRLLGGPKRITTLLPAVDLFSTQSGRPIQVRVSANFHERYLFVDRAACYLSGASFKDGAKNAPAVLVQIIDAFAAMFDTYERLWNRAKVER